MAISKQLFSEIEIGQVMCSVTAPWHHPTLELCERMGTVVEKIEGKWARELKLECTDGTIAFAVSAKDPKTQKGCGWYLYNE